MLKAFQFNLTMLSGIALLVGVFLVYNTMAFSVAHHRREIGILRALGMERRAITGLFLLEAGLLGLVGGVMGCWFGVFLAGGLTTLIGQSVGELYGVTSLAVSQVHPWLLAGSDRDWGRGFPSGSAPPFLGCQHDSPGSSLIGRSIRR